MHNWNLEKLYIENVSKAGTVSQPRHIVREYVGKASKKELAKIIAAQDVSLEPGSSSKDVRIQPVGPYDISKFTQTLNDAGLEVIKIVKPGEEGSTSGQLRTYIVQDKNGYEYPVTLGKGKGFSTVDEDLVLSDLDEQIKSLLLQNNVDHITIDINGYQQKVDGIKTTPGTPKSDFNFTYKNKPVLFISHKAGKKASDYQQYGGTTCKSSKDICQHEEVNSFVDEIKEKFPQGMPPGESLWKKIKDPELKKLALFGADYGGEYGIDNVNALFQGNMKIVPEGENLYKINANHIVYNGEIPTGDYEPVLYARYSGSRGGNHGIKDLRTSISPIAKISAKKREERLTKANISKLQDTNLEDSLNKL